MSLFSPRLLYIVLSVLAACQTPEKSAESSARQAEENAQHLPESLNRVLQYHGGLEKWRNMQSLYFEIETDPQNEKHFVQLWDRRDRVEGSNFTMGYDGEAVWMEADTTYKGNPEFYHNLMFYFYAMPFVLADPGINYQATEPLTIEGVEYPGIAVSYHQGVGTSSKDQYFLYYHPQTFQMAWLGYTVTYFSGETSNDIHWIKYSAWGTFNGLKLPTTMIWYHYENGSPTEPRNSVQFVNIKISEDAPADNLFVGP